MTPTEKAIWLFEKHYYCDNLNDDKSAQLHAILTVKIILEDYRVKDINRDFLKQVLIELKSL